VVLDDRAQQHVGAEALRLAARQLEQLLRGPAQFRIAQAEAASVPEHRFPLVVAAQEEQRRIGRHPHLAVEAGFVQLAAALEQGRSQDIGLGDRRLEDRRGQAFGLRIHGVEENQPPISEEAVERPAEGLCKRASRTVGGFQLPPEFGGRRSGRPAGGVFREAFADRLRESERADRPRARMGFAEETPPPVVACGAPVGRAHVDLCDLREVVIVGVHPEDRHGRDFPVFQLRRQRIAVRAL
jgi:hypothetical protein